MRQRRIRRETQPEREEPRRVETADDFIARMRRETDEYIARMRQENADFRQRPAGSGVSRQEESVTQEPEGADDGLTPSGRTRRLLIGGAVAATVVGGGLGLLNYFSDQKEEGAPRQVAQHRRVLTLGYDFRNYRGVDISRTFFNHFCSQHRGLEQPTWPPRVEGAPDHVYHVSFQAKQMTSDEIVARAAHFAGFDPHVFRLLADRYNISKVGLEGGRPVVVDKHMPTERLQMAAIALMEWESRLNRNALGTSGDTGLFQILKSVGPRAFAGAARDLALELDETEIARDLKLTPDEVRKLLAKARGLSPDERRRVIAEGMKADHGLMQINEAVGRMGLSKASVDLVRGMFYGERRERDACRRIWTACVTPDISVAEKLGEKLAEREVLELASRRINLPPAEARAKQREYRQQELAIDRDIQGMMEGFYDGFDSNKNVLTGLFLRFDDFQKLVGHIGFAPRGQDALNFFYGMNVTGWWDNTEAAASAAKAAAGRVSSDKKGAAAYQAFVDGYPVVKVRGDIQIHDDSCRHFQDALERISVPNARGR